MSTTAPISLSPVLVTGGCGFVGSSIVRHLRKEYPDCDVHVMDINTNRNVVPGVTYHTCDMTSLSEVQTVFEKAKPKTVFHVASPDPVKSARGAFEKINVGGAQNILSCAKAVGTQVLVNTAASSIIHDNKSDMINVDETYPIVEYPEQRVPYTLSKAKAHKAILAANRDYGTNDSGLLTASVLPAAIWGPYDETFTGYIASNAKAGKSRIQVGSENRLFDTTFIFNLVHGQILLAQALLQAHGKPPPAAEKRIDGEAFIMTSCEPMKFWDFSRAMAEAAGYPVDPKDIKVIPTWLAWIMATVGEIVMWIVTFGTKQPTLNRFSLTMVLITRTLNCDKARQRLGYQPKYSIAEGLEITGKWLKEREAEQITKGSKGKYN